MKKKETLLDILLKVSELRMDIETAEKRILRLFSISVAKRKVIQSFPDWYKELSLLELQMQALKDDMPRNLIEKRCCVTDIETFDMKLTAMQNRLHRAFEELKGNIV